MNNTMSYKDYVGSVEFSESDGVFFGKVMGTRALISYEGTSANELVSDFHEAVDEYLKLCESKGIEPEKTYKGSFNVRISPELHRNAAIYAAEHQMSLNRFVENAVMNELAMQSAVQRDN
ncbi:MAG: type II toxin-antitoxin system HicB family antitoxin [Firmicutes bacterium]|nr:type II toxin-antitoxin system HicB family antitoxin [Bacillota bacterium]